MSSSVEALVSRWREFWFARVPPHAYAVFRIAVGIAGVATMVVVSDPAVWQLDGITPPSSDEFGIRQWLREHGLGALAGASLRYALLLGYLALTVGVFSRATAIAMFFGSSIMLWWNWYPFSAAQHLLHNFTLYLLWYDPGRVWSWDALRARRRGVAPAVPEPMPIWPLRLVRCQLAIMYFAAGYWKLGNPDWRAGDALHYILNNNLFQRMPGSVPVEMYPITVALTYVTLFWELFFPFMLWWGPTRGLALALGVALHLGMWSSIELGVFSLTVLAGYTAFLNPWRVEAWARRRLSRRRRGPASLDAQATSS